MLTPVSAGPGKRGIAMVMESRGRSVSPSVDDGGASRANVGKVRDLAFFTDASPELIAPLDPVARWFACEPNGPIIDFKDETSDVLFVVEGLVRIVIHAPGGKKRILGELGPDQFFGEMSAFDESARSANVTARARTRVCILSGKAFLEAIHRSPRTCRRLRRLLSQRIRTSHARLLEDAAKPGRIRLLSELLRMSLPREGSAMRVIGPPPLEHELAARIGIRREAVSRVVADLVRRGQLERKADALLLKDPIAMQHVIDAHLDDAPMRVPEQPGRGAVNWSIAAGSPK